MSEQTEGNCDHCEKVDIPVVFMVDPFIAEVGDGRDETPTFWCDECAERRRDDI